MNKTSVLVEVEPDIDVHDFLHIHILQNASKRPHVDTKKPFVEPDSIDHHVTALVPVIGPPVPTDPPALPPVVVPLVQVLEAHIHTHPLLRRCLVVHCFASELAIRCFAS